MSGLLNGRGPLCWVCDGMPGGCPTPAECSAALSRAVAEDMGVDPDSVPGPVVAPGSERAQ